MKYIFPILTTFVLSFSCAISMDKKPASKQPKTEESRSVKPLSDKQVTATEKSRILSDEEAKNINPNSKLYKALDEWAYADIASWGNR